MKQIIGILEYGCGNIRSVLNAIKSIGAEFKIIEEVNDINETHKLILPGVGSFDSAMKTLFKSKMVDALNEYVENKSNKLLGICLGMQVLCNSSEEGKLPGLGYIDADVRNLKNYSDVKIPHMGWNTVEFSREDQLVRGLGNAADYYFVHSYCVIPTDSNVTLGVTNHGISFASMVQKNNIWGVQFHPEKSQNAGLLLLKNFIESC